MKTTSVSRFGCSVFAFSLLAVGAARAQVDRSWDNLDAGVPQSGSFGEANHWNPTGIPGDGDWIILNHAAAIAYTIELDQTRALAQGGDPLRDAGLTVGTDRVILDLKSFDLTLTGTAGVQDDPKFNMLLAPANGDNAHLTIQGGGKMTVYNLAMSLGTAASNTVSTLIVKGENTELDVTRSAARTLERPRIGATSTAHIRVESGAKVTLRGPIVAYEGGPGSSIVVTGNAGVGKPSTLVTTGTLEIGRRASASVTIENGGRLDAVNITLSRGGSNSEMALHVDNGTVVATGDLTLGTVLASGINRTFRTEVTNGGSLTVRDVMIADSSTTAANKATSILDVDGASTSFTARQVVLGHSSHASETFMTVSRGAAATARNLVMRAYWSNDELLAAGHLALTGGSTLTAQDLTSANQGTSYTLTLNNSSTATAPLRILDGAAYDGNISLNSMVFTFDFADTPKTGTFGVLRYDGTRTGTFSGLVEDTWYTWSGDPAIEYKLNYDSNDGTGSAIMLTVIPEPHTLGLLLAAGALLALRRRRG